MVESRGGVGLSRNLYVMVSLLASARWPSCLGVVRQEGIASLPLGGRPDPGWSYWTGISNPGGPVCTAEVPEKKVS